jgi:predicted dehydrogenase
MIRAAIIGAGKIAQGFDDPHGEAVLTHAKAYQKHGGFELVAFCDTDLERARIAAARWKVPHAVDSIRKLAALNPEVISICTPDETHQDMLAACLDLHPRLVFCEKPLALDSCKARDLVERYERENIGLLVNYSRRWSDPAREGNKLIQDGACGKILSIRARYYGGWFHNGSHLVDLIGLFFKPSVAGGGLLRKESLGNGDFRITGSVVLRRDSHAFPFHFECLNEGRASHLELELLFEEGAFWMGERNGTVWRTSGISENAVYPGYYELSEGQMEKTDPSDAMRRAAANIHGFLSHGEPLLSNGATALATLGMCREICSLPETVKNSIWQN